MEQTPQEIIHNTIILQAIRVIELQIQFLILLILYYINQWLNNKISIPQEKLLDKMDRMIGIEYLV